MLFSWYILRYSFSRKTTELYNIFSDEIIQAETEKAIRRYLRAPSKFAYLRYTPPGKRDCSEYGFNALVSKIESIIYHGDSVYYEETMFPDCMAEEEEKPWGIYEQCAPNMVELTYSCIRQYKEQKRQTGK